MSTSTLIPTDVENTVKNKKVDAFLLAPLFKLAPPELKGRRGFDLVARAASEAFRRSKTTVYRWISNICSVLSRCPLCPSFCQPGAAILKPGVTAIHLLWSAAVRGTDTFKLPFLHLHCVQFPLVLPALMNGQIGSCQLSALFFHLSMSTLQYCPLTKST